MPPLTLSMINHLRERERERKGNKNKEKDALRKCLSPP